MDDNNTWQRVEMRRDQAVRAALEAADRIVCNASDGSLEETYYLTAQVAQKMIERALYPFTSRMLRTDVERRHKKRMGRTIEDGQ
mgnify:CR=1 FL=1